MRLSFKSNLTTINKQSGMNKIVNFIELHSGEEDKKIEFSEDRETMEETSYILGVESGTEDFTYVDSKTKP